MKLNKSVLSCAMEKCAFNRQKYCHAFAITVGDKHPKCDTFTSVKIKGGEDQVTGRVGACKVTRCSHNSALECTAEGVQISIHGRHAD